VSLKIYFSPQPTQGKKLITILKNMQKSSSKILEYTKEKIIDQTEYLEDNSKE
jgi:hypothetical protein